MDTTNGSKPSAPLAWSSRTIRELLGIKRYSSTSFGAPDRIFTLNMDRYGEGYRMEIETFLGCVSAGTPLPVNAIDGLQAVYLAEAAGASLRLGKAIELKSNCEVTWNE